MIWIATLCLLVLAAWLFFNALNERRWVQAHSHDETVASDEGLLPSFSRRKGVVGVDGKVSIDQEDGLFAAAVSRVQEKTAQYGERFFESKAAAARIGDGEQRPQSAKDENTLFGRAVARIGASAERIDHKLDQKIKAASSQTSHAGTHGGEDEGLFARTTRKVAAKSDQISQRVAHGAKNMAKGYSDNRAASGDDGMFGKMVGKVSDGLDKFESRVGSKVSQSTASSPKNDDLVSRVASKVASASKDTVEKPDK